jgi:hypothetical protein
MKNFLTILFLFSSCSTQSDKTKYIEANTTKLIERPKPKVISDSTNTLTGKTENLELDYIVWGCACANWVTATDFDKYQDNKLAEHCIFIEPISDSLALPIYFDASRHNIKVKGEFYTRPDYPKGTVQTEEELEKAKVFRYTEIEVVDKPNFKPDTKIQTHSPI